MPALIIWGFIYHYFTFKVIPYTDVLYLVFGYLGLATFTIIFMHVYDMGYVSEKLRYVRLFVPLLLQFAIGSMIGGVFIFYWFSGSVFVSWPFIVLVVVLIVGLELYKHYLENPVVQFGLYNFAAFLLLAVALPYFFKSIDPGYFIAAGWTSLILTLVIVFVLRKSQAVVMHRNKITIVCLFVFVVMNTFYFSNLIPPVPLSIRDVGVYHGVSRSGNDYIVQAEPENFWQKLSFVKTIHLVAGDRAYVYTSIYSPTDLNTDVIHDWQHYDDTQKKWVSVSKVQFHVTGGRADGFRGYSYHTNIQSGKWRVYTETPRGQILGRYQFTVESVENPPAVVEEIK